jgi:hypothetical protein
VHPLPNAQLKKLALDVRKVLSLQPNDKITAEALGKAACTNLGRQALQACYAGIGQSIGAGTPANAVSMSLYSGPFRHGGSSNWEWSGHHRSYLHHHFMSSHFHAHWHDISVGCVGWIGSGDAELKDANVRKQWIRFFSPIAEKLRVILLSHHGSRHSFHRSILDLGDPSIAVSSSNPKHKKYRHPNKSVVQTVRAMGLSMIKVTKNPTSQFEEEIESD